MDILQETQKAIDLKIAQISKYESDQIEKQGGKLKGFQIVKIETVIHDIQRLQNLLIHIEGLKSEIVGRPMTVGEYVLHKHHYTQKDLLLKMLVKLVDEALDQKEGSQLGIKVQRQYFLYILREIANRYKQLTMESKKKKLTDILLNPYTDAAPPPRRPILILKKNVE
ncbi:hypothetical protein [Leadbetterella byssophila]|uniref:hypothetical protein n=1 Tax=Leadbetterella byssophila TaxID=316068 RepID=UPI0039A1A07A